MHSRPAIWVILALLACACNSATPDPDQDCRFACETDSDCRSGFGCRNGLCASTPGEDCLEDFEPDAGEDADGGAPADDGGTEDGDEQPGDDAGIPDGDPDVDDGGDLEDGDAGTDADACSAMTTITLPDERLALGLAYFAGYLYVVSHLEGESGTCYVSHILPSTGVEISGASSLALDGRGITVSEYVVVGDADNLNLLNTFMSSVIQVLEGPGEDIYGIAYAEENYWMVNPASGWVYGIDQSGNPGSGFQPQGVSMELVQGLEWDGQGFWMDTGETRLQRFTSAGLLQETVDIDCLPAESDIYDIAIGDGKIFISTGTGTIYVQAWPQK